MKRMTDGIPWKKVLLWAAVGILVIPMLAIGAILIFAGLVYPLDAAEHYRRAYQDPVTVTASVTKHDTYDDDGDTDYRSYISYTVNGVRYHDISFENADTREELTPIGNTVKAAVSREDPSALLSELKSSGQILAVTVPVVMFLLSEAWSFAIHTRRSRQHRGTPDQETLQRDGFLTILGQKRNSFWLLACVGYILLYLRYPMILWNGIPTVSVICGFLWLYFVYRAGCRMRCLRNGEYTLSRDRLVEKTCDTDSDGHDTYTLHYSSGDKAWQHNTTRRNYDKAQVGTEVLAVYLPGEKKPLCHYDQEGSAC